jgi:hypothetical protein
MSTNQAKHSMLRRITRPSPTMVVSALALLVTFSGIAGALPGKNRVDSGDVKKDALKGKDIKESTLKLPATAVAAGLKISVYHQDVGVLDQDGSPTEAGGATANCPAGKQAIAGGGLSDAFNTSTATIMTDSRPSQGPAGIAPGALVKDGESFTGWRAFWNNDYIDLEAAPVVYVVCVG